MIDVELFTTPLCPFAHRVRLVLAEKGIPYRLSEVDVRNKSAAFLAVSRHGRVPALRHANHHVSGSAIINEYLDESFPEPPLLPKAPARRAQARFWVDFANSRLFATTASLLYGSYRRDPLAGLDQLTAALRFMESEVLATKPHGPYWLGSELSLVDLTFYPWFEQVAVLEQFRDFRMPGNIPRLLEWRNTIARRAATQAIAKPPQFYIEGYARLERLILAQSNS